VRRCRLGWQVGDLLLMAIKTANRLELKRRLPGYIATGLVILTISFWTLWSMGESYYEAWGISHPGPVGYLMPAVVCLALTLVVLTWPRFGGWLIIVIGAVFTAWWWTLAAGRWRPGRTADRGLCGHTRLGAGGTGAELAATLGRVPFLEPHCPLWSGSCGIRGQAGVRG
jgi:hypothetical protein